MNLEDSAIVNFIHKFSAQEILEVSFFLGGGVGGGGWDRVHLVHRPLIGQLYRILDVTEIIWFTLTAVEPTDLPQIGGAVVK
jgi:hypothetical protein